jgi:hypothetical protein
LHPRAFMARPPVNVDLKFSGRGMTECLITAELQPWLCSLVSRFYRLFVESGD